MAEHICTIEQFRVDGKSYRRTVWHYILSNEPEWTEYIAKSGSWFPVNTVDIPKIREEFMKLLR